MNEYDSNRILDLVKKIGYSTSEDINQADCLILNTCHIREKASEKVYHDIGRVKKNLQNKKKPIVIITGCVAQAEGEEMLKREKYIDAVVGPQSYHNLPCIIKKIETKDERFNSTEFEVIEKFDTLNSLKNTNLKVSSFLTIQEGCDKFCNFCVVPYTRGPEYSRSFEDIKRAGVDVLTLGQYMRPTINHLPVEKWYTPDEFDYFKKLAIETGFLEVASGPMVRSSYRADRIAHLV
mgnify:CR=1 FL=1